ncbi:hypothetical protein P8452_62363 [Trifolium repens]|nr:hypothetical protein P8452_62363 [Trifolium repens]
MFSKLRFALLNRVARYGELAPECVHTYYKYGRALLYKAKNIKSSGVNNDFGTVVKYEESDSEVDNGETVGEGDEV